MVTSFDSVPDVIDHCYNSNLKSLVLRIGRYKAIKWDFIFGTVHEDGTVKAVFQSRIKNSDQFYRLQSKVALTGESHHYSVI